MADELTPPAQDPNGTGSLDAPPSADAATADTPLDAPPSADAATAGIPPGPDPAAPALPPAPPVAADEIAPPAAAEAAPPSPDAAPIAAPIVAPPVAAHEIGVLPPPTAATPEGGAEPPRSSRTLVVALVVVGAVVLVLLVAGIIAALASDDDDDPYSLEAAFENVAGASTLQYDLEITADGSSVLTVAGVVDGDVASLQLDLGAILGTDIVAGDAVEVVVDSGEEVLYLRADSLIPPTGLDLLLPDIGWLAVDFDQLPDGDDLAGPLSGDPLELLDAIRADAAAATDLGEEQLDGVTTRHYQFTVDVAEAIASTEAISELMDDLGLDVDVTGLLGEATFDIWVTEDNEIRRATLAVTIDGQAVTLVIDVVGMNEPVDVEVPTDDVFDLSDIIGS
jgi:hypothetical protein